MLRFLIIAAFVLMAACHEPMVPYFEHKYPRCKVMKVNELPDGWVEALLQCGVTVKVVRVRKGIRNR